LLLLAIVADLWIGSTPAIINPHMCRPPAARGTSYYAIRRSVIGLSI
jgi:hypothetical protein